MKHKQKLILLLLSCLLLSQGSAFASGSIFSGLGYGSFEKYGSSRAYALGNAGLALNDSLALNALNPALIAGIRQTRVSIGGYLSHHTMRDHQAEDVEDWAQFEYFSIAVLLKKGIALGFFLTPYSRADYRYGWNGSISGEPYYESYQGNGGLSRAALNFAWSFGNWGKLGSGLSVIWGQVEELRGSYFESSSYQDIEFLNTKQWMAYGGSFGLTFEPFRKLSLGAVFEPEVPINLDQIFAYSTEDSSVISESEYRLAARYGLGFSYRFSPQWQTVGQLIYSPWGELDELPQDPDSYRNAVSTGLGAEWIPGSRKTDHFFKRLQYRLGFRWETGYVESQNNPLEAYFATFGLGYPFNEGQNRLDVSLEYGVRGDLSSNGGQENLLKIRVGLNLGGSWFVRSKPSWED